MGCAVLGVLHLYGYNSFGERSHQVVFLGHQIRGQRGVQAVGQQDKLKLHLLAQFHTNSIGFFQEDGIAPEVILKTATESSVYVIFGSLTILTKLITI